MKTTPVDSIALILLPLVVLRFMRVTADDNARTSSKFNVPFINHHKSQLIAFDSKGGEIEVNWDVSIPFFTLPLNHVGENGEVSPLLTVNTKALSVAGVLTALATLAVPLVSKPGPKNYRSSDSQWSRMGDAINEIILGNSYITPCIQRIVCSIVSEASHSDNPTSTDKIIDGLSRMNKRVKPRCRNKSSWNLKTNEGLFLPALILWLILLLITESLYSHEWFKNFANGTVLQEAVKIGREGHHDCGRMYKECFITPRILKSMMVQIGVI